MDDTLFIPIGDSSASQDEVLEDDTPTETLTHEWYIRVRVSFQNTTSLAPQIKDLEQKVIALHDSELPYS